MCQPLRLTLISSATAPTIFPLSSDLKIVVMCGSFPW